MSKIHDIEIERVLLGEATSEQRARVMGNPEARARLEALEAENAAFRKAHPADAVVPEIERRLHLARTKDAVQKRRDRWGLAGMVLAPLAAVGLAVVSYEPPPAEVVAEPSAQEGLEPSRIKQVDPRILVYRQVNGKSRGINAGTVLRARDRLQLGYQAGWAEHGMLVSVDGRGAVTRHTPDDNDTMLRDGRTLLPHAYELDDAPSFERFFLVASESTFDVDAVMRAAETLAKRDDARKAPLPTDGDLFVSDFLILKDVL